MQYINVTFKEKESKIEEDFMFALNNENMDTKHVGKYVDDFVMLIKNMKTCFDACERLGKDTFLDEESYSELKTWRSKLMFCIKMALTSYERLQQITVISRKENIN